MQVVRGRVLALDALRGLAVLLMVVWHFLVWLSEGARGAFVLVGRMPFGYLAGPLFLLSTGMGTRLSVARRRRRGEQWGRILLHFVKRCVALVLGGVALNFVLWGSRSVWIWDVLEAIGASNLFIVLLLRLGFSNLALGATASLAVALPWAGFDAPGWLPLPLRNALLEGVFPLFPWLGFAIVGAICGGWLLEGRLRLVLALGVALLTLGLALNEVWPIRFSPKCPSFAPFSIGVGLLLFWLLLLAERGGALKPSFPLIHLGRTALGIYVWHYLGGLNLLRLLGAVGKVPVPFGLLISLLSPLPFWLGARLWLGLKGRFRPIIGPLQGGS